MKDEVYQGIASPHLKELFSERELQIMDAALEIFADKGYHASSTKEIAEKAGIAEGTIFRYFKTKKDILTRLASALFEKFLAPLVIRSIEEILEKHGAQPLEDVLKMILRDRLTLIRSNLKYIRLFLYEMQFHEDFKQTFFKNIIWKLSGMVTMFIEEKQKEGKIRQDLDGRAIVFSIVGMAGAFIVLDEFFHSEDKYSDEEIISHISQMVLYGIATKKE